MLVPEPSKALGDTAFASTTAPRTCGTRPVGPGHEGHDERSTGEAQRIEAERDRRPRGRTAVHRWAVRRGRSSPVRSSRVGRRHVRDRRRPTVAGTIAMLEESTTASADASSAATTKITTIDTWSSRITPTRPAITTARAMSRRIRSTSTVVAVRPRTARQDEEQPRQTLGHRHAGDQPGVGGHRRREQRQRDEPQTVAQVRQRASRPTATGSCAAAAAEPAAPTGRGTARRRRPLEFAGVHAERSSAGRSRRAGRRAAARRPTDSGRSRGVDAEHLAQGVADLAERGVGAQRVLHAVEQVVGAVGGRLDRGQRRLDRGGVTVGLVAPSDGRSGCPRVRDRSGTPSVRARRPS